MATLVTRTTDQPDGTTAKGSELTHAELDANFINLNSDKLSDIVDDTSPQLGGALDTNGSNIDFGDSGKAVFGDGDDLQIYHDGSHSYIKEDGTGNLHIQGHNVVIEDASGNNMAFFHDNQEVRLYYNHNVKLETTNTGITITGEIVTTGGNSTNWNTAYGWGDHGAAGYLSSGDTAASLTITSADINGGTINGATIGGTTAAAGTFTTFTSTGIDDNGTSTAITIDSSQNVGIGTTSPGQKLHVSSSAGTNVAITSGTSNSSILMFGDSADVDAGRIGYDNSTDLMYFNVNAAERMRIDSSGRLLLGRTTSTLGGGNGDELQIGSGSGSAGMTIHSTTTGTGDIQFADGTTGNASYRGLIRYTHSNDSMGFWSAGTERMRIDSDGKVGIGTSAPSFPLDIRAPSSGDAVLRVHNQHTGSGDDAILRLSIGGATADSIIQFGDSGDADAGRISYHHNGNTMRFWTGASEEMRLENDGDLHVDGNVIAYSTTISDERLKDDVQDITGALDTVDALRGVTYTWNAGSREGQRDYGVIAQEVEQVIPEIVHDTTMPLLGDEETVYKTVDYEKLCAVLINAVSELRAEVEALKNGASV
ncbi:MAG: putative chaperone of endosialidase [Prokaryotic dsDNA virus sp.]|nr:MAG: putative chaperone of endosialidase [Prokaryotic dsDNA virus sp.]|tara:strand:+ start:13481 stop:15262 length:1782 start_codon:yes stop_codon:yes gene_type:complete